VTICFWSVLINVGCHFTDVVRMFHLLDISRHVSGGSCREAWLLISLDIGLRMKYALIQVEANFTANVTYSDFSQIKCQCGIRRGASCCHV
jgi:hypothetical protein